MNYIDSKWKETSNEWKRNNPATHEGYWFCIVGGYALTDGNQDAVGGLRLNLDHNDSRARRPDRKYDLSNLNPICSKHNREKGSQSLTEYLETNPNKRCGI